MAATKIFSKLANGLSDFKGATLNTIIAAGTVGIEQLLNATVYYCPCVEPKELGNCSSTVNSQNSTAKCTPRNNYIYGLVFIIVPAFALFLLVAASTPRLWKLWTGICTKTKETKARKEKICWTVLSTFGRAMVAPVAWVCFALLDGKYYACFVTPLPYNVPSTLYPDCQAVAKAKIPTYSDAYRDNRSFSQFYGWAVLAASVLIGFTSYAVSRCLYPLTYYHAKYYDLYRTHEEAEFDQEMDVKAQKQAESNVLKFMSEFRTKKLWDRISTVYEFHRNPKHQALYSYLHEFIQDEEESKKKEENNGTAIEMEELTDNDAVATSEML